MRCCARDRDQALAVQVGARYPERSASHASHWESQQRRDVLFSAQLLMAPMSAAEDRGHGSFLGAEIAGDIAFQVLDGGLLFGDHRFDGIADRDHTEHRAFLDDRQVADTVFGHHRHDIVDGL